MNIKLCELLRYHFYGPLIFSPKLSFYSQTKYFIYELLCELIFHIYGASNLFLKKSAIAILLLEMLVIKGTPMI